MRTHLPCGHRLPAALLLLAGLLLLPAPPARAGGDDYEFGCALAATAEEKRDRTYLRDARRVFESVLADTGRSQKDKDRCRYALSALKSSEARIAVRDHTASPVSVAAVFDEAIADLATYARAHPRSEHAGTALLESGTVGLAFARWRVKEHTLEGEPDEQARREAGRAARAALERLDLLRIGHDEERALPLARSAHFHWVLGQYDLALCHERGSPTIARALDDAIAHLAGYVAKHRGDRRTLMALGTQGRAWARRIRCLTEEEDQLASYERALDCFVTCIDAAEGGRAQESALASAYFGLARTYMEARQIGLADPGLRGAECLKRFADRHAGVLCSDEGITALIAWSKVASAQSQMGNVLTAALGAYDAAKDQRNEHLALSAGRLLRAVVSSPAFRHGTNNAMPDALLRVGNALFNAMEWRLSIRAYQQVIASVPRTPEGMQTYLIDAWRRSAYAYQQQGDLIGAALAYEPLHRAWVDGLIPRIDAEGRRNGYMEDCRRWSMLLWRRLFAQTGSLLFRRRFVEMRNAFHRDYPSN